eukprot:GHVT01025798.1.p1 GENE.GHVT01025798.1~~GHVT01025798.1.p1  ORF type:complete len:662 (-),score=90.29 GHVT01025798.1:117-2102(-)
MDCSSVHFILHRLVLWLSEMRKAGWESAWRLALPPSPLAVLGPLWLGRRRRLGPRNSNGRPRTYSAQNPSLKMQLHQVAMTGTRDTSERSTSSTDSINGESTSDRSESRAPASPTDAVVEQPSPSAADKKKANTDVASRSAPSFARVKTRLEGKKNVDSEPSAASFEDGPIEDRYPSNASTKRRAKSKRTVTFLLVGSAFAAVGLIAAISTLAYVGLKSAKPWSVKFAPWLSNFDKAKELPPPSGHWDAEARKQAREFLQGPGQDITKTKLAGRVWLPPYIVERVRTIKTQYDKAASLTKNPEDKMSLLKEATLYVKAEIEQAESATEAYLDLVQNVPSLPTEKELSDFISKLQSHIGFAPLALSHVAAYLKFDLSIPKFREGIKNRMHFNVQVVAGAVDAVMLGKSIALFGPTATAANLEPLKQRMTKFSQMVVKSFPDFKALPCNEIVAKFLTRPPIKGPIGKEQQELFQQLFKLTRTPSTIESLRSMKDLPLGDDKQRMDASCAVYSYLLRQGYFFPNVFRDLPIWILSGDASKRPSEMLAIALQADSLAPPVEKAAKMGTCCFDTVHRAQTLFKQLPGTAPEKAWDLAREIGAQIDEGKVSKDCSEKFIKKCNIETVAVCQKDNLLYYILGGRVHALPQISYSAIATILEKAPLQTK